MPPHQLPSPSPQTGTPTSSETTPPAVSQIAACVFLFSPPSSRGRTVLPNARSPLVSLPLAPPCVLSVGRPMSAAAPHRRTRAGSFPPLAPRFARAAPREFAATQRLGTLLPDGHHRTPAADG